MTKTEVWRERVGLSPHVVTVYEHPERDWVLYLRWRHAGNWKKRSLGSGLRDTRGRIKPELKRMALAEAERQYEILSGKRTAPGAAQELLRVGQTWAAVSAPGGPYAVPSRHTANVVTAIAHAVRIWGAETPWSVIERTRIRMLGRTRIDEIRAREVKRAAKQEPPVEPDPRAGVRGAEMTVAHVLTVAKWLRDEGRIPADAALPVSNWKADLRAYWQQVAPGQPIAPPDKRHTLVEMREILKAALALDPRFALLLTLGAEYRAGQVLRSRRSDVDADHKTLTIHGRGKKLGAVVELTPGQWSAWEAAIGPEGYLSDCERELLDYPLFPAGRLIKGKATPTKHGVGPTLGRNALIVWFAAAEAAAGVPHVKGRAQYGLRRVAVDAAEDFGISRKGMLEHGGWATDDIPLNRYATKERALARIEARDIRQKIRGETE